MTVVVTTELQTIPLKGRTDPARRPIRLLAVNLLLSTDDGALPRGPDITLMSPWNWSGLKIHLFRANGGDNPIPVPVVWPENGLVPQDWYGTAHRFLVGDRFDAAEEEEARNALRAALAANLAAFSTDDLGGGLEPVFLDILARPEGDYRVDGQAGDDSKLGYDSYLRSIAELPAPLPQAANLSFLFAIEESEVIDRNPYFALIECDSESLTGVPISPPPTADNLIGAYGDRPTVRYRGFPSEFGEQLDGAVNHDSMIVPIGDPNFGGVDEDDWLAELDEIMSEAFRPASLLIQLAADVVSSEGGAQPDFLASQDKRELFVKRVVDQALPVSLHDGSLGGAGGSLIDTILGVLRASAPPDVAADLATELDAEQWKLKLRAAAPGTATLWRALLSGAVGADRLEAFDKLDGSTLEWLDQMKAAVGALSSQDGLKAVFLARCDRMKDDNPKVLWAKYRSIVSQALDRVDIVREVFLDSIHHPHTLTGNPDPTSLWRKTLAETASGTVARNRLAVAESFSGALVAIVSEIAAVNGTALDTPIARELERYAFAFSMDRIAVDERIPEAALRRYGPLPEPGSVVVQLDRADNPGANGFNSWDDYQGAVLFVRRQDGAYNPSLEWQCANMADVTYTPAGAPESDAVVIARSVMVPAPLVERVQENIGSTGTTDTRQSTISYRGEPIIAESPVLDIFDPNRERGSEEGAIGSNLGRFTFEAVDLLGDATAMGTLYNPFAPQPVLATGSTLDLAAFVIGPGGALPDVVTETGTLARPITTRSGLDMFKADEIASVDLLRRQPVSAPRLSTEFLDVGGAPATDASKFIAATDDETTRAWQREELSFPKPTLPIAGERVKRAAMLDLGDLSDRFDWEEIEGAPLKLLHKAQERPGRYRARSMKFSLRAPGTGWETFKRWMWSFVKDDAVAKRDLITVLAEVENRKRDERAGVAGSTRADLTIDDPAVANFWVTAYSIARDGQVTELPCDDPVLTLESTPGTGLKLRQYQRPPVDVLVEPTDEVVSTLICDGTAANGIGVKVRPADLVLLQVHAIVPRADADRLPIGLPGWDFVHIQEINGAEYAVFEPFRMLLEGVDETMPAPEVVWRELHAELKQSKLRIRLKGDDAKMEMVSKARFKVQKWDWDGFALSQKQDDLPFGPLNTNETVMEQAGADEDAWKTAVGEPGPKWEAVGFHRRDLADGEDGETDVVVALQDGGGLSSGVFYERKAPPPSVAEYWRVRVELQSRYRGLLNSLNVRTAEPGSRHPWLGDRPWRGFTVKRRTLEPLPVPQVDMIVPLTMRTALDDDGASHDAGFLVMLEEPWYEKAGLAETLTAEVVLATPGPKKRGPEAATADGGATPADGGGRPALLDELPSRANFGVDPIRGYKPVDEGDIPSFEFEGPIGESSDTQAARRFTRGSFVMQVKAGDRMPPWYMAQVRIRRSTFPKGVAQADATTNDKTRSQWSAPVWVQRIPGESDWFVRDRGGLVRVPSNELAAWTGATTRSDGDGTFSLRLTDREQRGVRPVAAVENEDTATPSGDKRSKVIAMCAPLVTEISGRAAMGGIEKVAVVDDGDPVTFDGLNIGEFGNGGVIFLAEIWSSPVRANPSQTEEFTDLSDLFSFQGDADYDPNPDNLEDVLHGKDGKHIMTRISPPFRFEAP